MKKNILITGGAGFIGSHLVRLLVNKYPEYHIVNMDVLTYAGNLENLKDIEAKENYTFVKCDICDLKKVTKVFAEYKINSVIHLAAESHVDRSIEDPFSFAKTNVMGTLSLIQAAKEYWKGNFSNKLFFSESYTIVFKLIAVSVPFISMNRIFSGVVNGISDYKKHTKIEFISHFIAAVLLLISLYFYSIKGVLVAIAMTPIIQFTVLLFIFGKLLKDLNLSRKIDLAHRVSKTHMNRLGLQFDTNLVGMDARINNQVIIRPSEMQLDKLYKKQFDVFEKLKNNPTDALRTELSDINKQVKSIVKTTSGRLVGVTIDPNTLETSFEGLKKKYSLTKFMDENITMKDLAKFDANSPEQIKFLTKQLPKAVNAEIAKGFVPNDFKQILSNKKSREAILKYAQKKTPELIGTLKKAFKNPTSKIAMRVLTGPIIAVGAYKYGENFLKGTGIVDREYEQTASTANAPIVEKAFTTGEKAAGAAGLTTAATIGSKATKTDLLKGLRRSGKNLLKGIFKVAGAPTAAAGFGAYELGQGNIKSAGASLLAPELVGSLAPAGKGVLSRAGSILMNPFGKAARAFTPVGLATIAGGAGYDVYKEIKRRQKLTDEERLQEDIEAQAKDDEMMVGAAEGGFIEN